MKKLIFLFGTILLSLVVAGGASANLISNGDFEDFGGSFNHWTTSGDMQIGEAGLLAWAQGMDDHYALFGVNLGNDTSGLKQTFNVAGINSIRVSFNWAFDFLDFNIFGDDTFVSIIRQTGAPAMSITLQELVTGQVLGLKHGFYDQVIDISAYTKDSAILGFQLEEGAKGVFSAAGNDNVSIKAVPEPATMLLLGFGLLGLGGLSRKKLFQNHKA